MPRDFCQFCGYREGKDEDRQVPDPKLGEEEGRYARMFEQAQRTHRCVVCGIPITPDMLKSGEARLKHGRYYCKLHARQRERALNAILSPAYSQRRWISSFNTRTVGTALGVILIVISGLAMRTSRSRFLSSLASSSETTIRQPIVSLQAIRFDGVRKIGAGLHKAIVKGTVKAEGASVKRVVIGARIAFDGEELIGKTVISEGIEVGQSVSWEVSIFLTREQAEKLRKSEPYVSADVKLVE